MKHIIEKYKLTPHPEGGYYKEVYRSEQKVQSPIAKQERNAVTHIYFLLVSGQVSRFHKVLHDEIWNFHEGSPLKLVSFDGNIANEILIGPDCNNYNHVIKGGLYQAAETTGEYTLVGCSVAPGFDFSDFTFLADEEGLAKKLKTKYTEFVKYI